MRIDVTQADIDGGCRFDSDNCPVALAVMRHTGVACSVGLTRIRRLETNRTVLIADDVGRFVHAFDSGRGDVKPFSFELPDDFLA